MKMGKSKVVKKIHTNLMLPFENRNYIRFNRFAKGNLPFEFTS